VIACTKQHKFAMQLPSREARMMKRQCADCGGELVLAVNLVRQEASSDTGGSKSASTHWRCTTCGSVFTAARLRGYRRDGQKVNDSK
jgi:uncharacterized Zn finger protein